MIELLIILLCSCWSILINRFTPLSHLWEHIGMGETRVLKSDYILLEYIFYMFHGIIRCTSCMSSWLLFFVWLFYFGTFTGFLLMPIAWILTFVIEDRLLQIHF